MIEKITLPYELDGLEPYIDKETVDIHYNKHHQVYADNLNKLIKDTDFESYDLDKIVKEADGGPIANNAGQVWNHNFYWSSMTPDSKFDDDTEVGSRIVDQYGSADKFYTVLKQSGIKVFGSGWLWVVTPKDDFGKIELLPTSNGESLRVLNNKSVIPLLVCDLWEHAYYLNYQNKRSEYIKNFCKVINWEFAEQKFKAVSPA